MTLRFLRLLACQLLLLFACAQAQAGDGVDITRAQIEASEDGYKLNASYSLELTHGLEDALQYGLTLWFTTEVTLTRPRWYWFEDKAVAKTQTSRIHYNALTRQYHVSVNGGVQQSFGKLDDAMFLIRRPSRWLIAPRGALKQGETYNVTLRMGMDREYMSKPIQINSLNNADWRLDSGKKTFTYRAE